jgi:hypothetical protein
MKPFNIFTALLGLFFVVAGFDSLFRGLKDPSIGFIAGFFFLFLAFLNEKNGGNKNGPYISFAMSTMAFTYSVIGLVTGELSSKHHQFIRSVDPHGFWGYFLFLVAIGICTLFYGIWQFRKPR